MELSLLISKASAIAGSEYKLAKMLGISQTVVSDWKHGRRTCVPEDRAQLAYIAGEDAVQELITAAIEKWEGTEKGERLRTALNWRKR